MMKFMILVFVAILIAPGCGGRIYKVGCDDNGKLCQPPGEDQNHAYCCPADTSCCVRWGNAYGCCQGEVGEIPDAEAYD